MAGNPYIPADDIPTNEAAGRVPAAAAASPGTDPLAAIPAASAGRGPRDLTTSFTPNPGANPYIPADDTPEGYSKRVQLSGESAETSDARNEEESDARMEKYKQLPSIWQAPAIRTPAGAVAFGTNTGVDQIEKMLQKDNPGMTVDQDGKARIYSFPGDPQKYAWISGTTMPSDIARAIPGVIGSGLMTAAMTPAAVAGAPAAAIGVPAMIVANVVQSLLGEGAKKAVGMDFQPGNVGIAAAAPLVFEGGKWLAGGVGNIVGKAAATRGQKVDTLVDPLVQAGKDLMVKFGAKSDLSELAQDVAGATRSAAEATQRAASQAAAHTETTAAAAAAKADVNTLAAQTAAKDALDATKATAGGAATQVTNRLQDSVAAAGAKAEADKIAASAPVESAVGSITQALQNWGAGEASSLDKKFLDYASGVLKDMKKQVNALYKQVREKFPKTARVTPRKSLDTLRTAINEELAGTDKELQSKLVRKIKRVMFPKPAENGTVRMPRMGSVAAMRKLASKAGKIGTEWAGEDAAVGKHMGRLLKRLEQDMARELGAGELLDRATEKAAEQFAYQKALKTALGVRGGKALTDVSTIPARDKAARDMIAGNLRSLEQIMAAAPPGTKQEVMADIVNRAIDPSKGPEHMVGVIKTIANSTGLNELVFKNLPPGARKQLLGFGANAERALVDRAAGIVAADAGQKAAVKALRRTAALDKRGIRAAAEAEKRATREAETAALRKIAGEKADTTATAKIGEQAATEAAAQAKRLDIALAPELRSAGKALFNGDIRPFDEMLKSAPGKEGELAASTLYHGFFDPADTGPEALRRMTEGLAKLEASPVAFRRIKSLLPNATSDIEAVTDLARVIYSGTAAGGRRAEGALNALASMGPWAAGRTAGTAAGIGTGLAGGGLATSAATGLGATVLGRMLASRFAKDATIETKAANAFLASDMGRGLLKHLKLDKPITQGYMNRLGVDKAVKAVARVYGMTPVRFVRRLTEHTLREAGEQALTPNDTEKEK